MSNSGYELLIVGAGVSGLSAAATAAKYGMNTLLIDQHSFVGGTAAAAMHNYICGLFANDPSSRFKMLNEGITIEMVKYLDQFAGCERESLGRLEVYSFELQRMIDFFMHKIRNSSVNLALNTTLTAVYLENGLVDRVALKRNDRDATYQVKTMIDAGAGAVADVVCDSKVCVIEDDEPQSKAFIFTVVGVEKFDEVDQIKLPYIIREASIDGRLPKDIKQTIVMHEYNQKRLRFKVTIDQSNIRDAVAALQGVLAESFKNFQKVKVDSVSPFVLKRDCRRIAGRYILTKEDVLSGRKFSDKIKVNAAWPIEFWPRGDRTRYEYLEPGEYYQIPAGCLQSKDMLNLFACGKSFSSDGRAMASARVMGTCIPTGEAAAKMAFDFL